MRTNKTSMSIRHRATTKAARIKQMGDRIQRETESEIARILHEEETKRKEEAQRMTAESERTRKDAEETKAEFVRMDSVRKDERAAMERKQE